MYINSKDIIGFHWWKDYMYMNIKSKGLIRLNNVESMFIEEWKCCNNYDQLIDNINRNKGINDINIVKNFVLEVLETLNPYFVLDDSNIENSISISGEKGSTYPQTINVSLTNNCLHKCIHCFKGSFNNVCNVDYNSLCGLLDKFSGKTQVLQLTGGEAMLYPYIVQLIDRYFKKYSIIISTSGYGIKKDMYDIFEKVNGVQISLYNTDEQKHNRFTNRPDSYKKIMETINELKLRRVPISIASFIYSRNMEEVEEMVKFCIANNIKYLNFGVISRVGRAESLQDFVLPADDYEFVRKEYNNLQKKYRGSIVLRDYDSKNQNRLVEDSPFLCGAGTLTWNIMETGDIQPCGMYIDPSLSMGNINDEKYLNIVNGDLDKMYKKWRQQSYSSGKKVFDCSAAFEVC